MKYLCWINYDNFQLGVVLLEQGRAQQALAYLDKALEMDPEHQQALLNSALLIQVILHVFCWINYTILPFYLSFITI